MSLPEIHYNGKLNGLQGRLAKHLITQSYMLIRHLASCSGMGIFSVSSTAYVGCFS